MDVSATVNILEDELGVVGEVKVPTVEASVWSLSPTIVVSDEFTMCASFVLAAVLAPEEGDEEDDDVGPHHP